MSAIFPNVPLFEGVPPVLRQLGVAIPGPIDALLGDAAEAPTSTIWAIYDQDGNQVLVADSFVDFEYVGESRQSDYPIEQGGFESYNKVALPTDIRVTMTKSGTAAERAAFLDTLESFRQSTELFDILAADVTYLKQSIVRQDYRRTAETGASLLRVSIRFSEVRENAKVEFTKTAAPSGADTVNDGAVQPKALSAKADAMQESYPAIGKFG